MSNSEACNPISKQVKRIINIPNRLRHEFRISRLRLDWLRRCRIMNNLPGVFVPKSVAFFSKTAKIDLEPAGYFAGGTVTLSSEVKILDGVILAPWGGSIHLDENVFLGPYCVLYGEGGIKIGKDTMIAGHTFIAAANHTFSDLTTPVCRQQNITLGVTIGEDVWIGCGVRILDGVSIGSHCVIGAGAVVTKSLPSFSIAVGTPAKIVGRRGEA